MADDRDGRHLGPKERKALGVWYTPPAVVEAALSGLPLEGNVCDFACGTGHFLVAEALRRQRAGQPDGVIAEALFGRDVDGFAVEVCRERLRALLGHHPAIEAQVRVGNGLTDPLPRMAAVAANPPFRAGRLADLAAMRSLIPTAEYQLDPYLLFLDRALRLLQPGGKAAVVTPETWLSNRRCGALRAFLLGENRLERLVHLPVGTFAAGVETCLTFFRQGGVTAPEVPTESLDGQRRGMLLFEAEVPDAPVAWVQTLEDRALLQASRGWNHTLAEVAEVARGINPYHHTTHSPEAIAARIHHSSTPQGAGWRSELRGRHLVAPYCLSWPGDTWVEYGPGLKEPRHPRLFEGPRLLIRKILGATVHGVFTDQPYVCDQSIYIVRPRPSKVWDLHTLLACVNSRLMASLLRTRHRPHERIFPQLKLLDLKEFPLPPVDPQGPLARHVADLARGEPSPQATEAIEAGVAALYGRLDGRPHF